MGYALDAPFGLPNLQAQLEQGHRVIIFRPLRRDLRRLHCHSIDLLWSHMELGRISAIFRYPVKSMAGELLDVATLGWHGIEGDRRLAFRRLTDKSGFPWLTASKLPQLLLYKP